MSARLPEALRALHDRAVAEGRDTYVDPATGFTVMTAQKLLARGHCCGSGLITFWYDIFLHGLDFTH